jgi:hypothetical protein
VGEGSGDGEGDGDGEGCAWSGSFCVEEKAVGRKQKAESSKMTNNKR